MIIGMASLAVTLAERGKSGRMAEGLGIELENARVKLLAVGSSGMRSLVHPLPFRPVGDRQMDVAEGFAAALAEFTSLTGILPRQVPVVVAASHHFAYPAFRIAHEHLLTLLAEHLPNAFLAASDGLWSLAQAKTGAGYLPFVLARTLGIELATVLHGALTLALDVGSTSTEIVPLLRGQLAYAKTEPESSDLSERNSRARLQDGRLLWIGSLETPLEYLAPVAAGYRMVPRKGRMAAVTGLLADDPWLAALLPDREHLRLEVAQAVGLDTELLGDAVYDIAHALREKAIETIAIAIRQVMARELPAGCQRAAIMGLGKNELAAPALARCGIRQLVDIEAAAGVPLNLGATYGLALAAACLNS
ncbi:MAG: hypothetical protein HY692_02180 [Cyanobacteria bacterium NC_groundwater_1444_Ag_S-0.65um_54_12]|nr:hypothetical protein [Cyanobacteria bacterium NC_groundwater_1444_Ag_S-0.65um_54_12]